MQLTLRVPFLFKPGNRQGARQRMALPRYSPRAMISFMISEVPP